MFDWDDLRMFLGAARPGSLATAGQRLGVDAATVGRRIARLETTLKATLFVRSRSGLELTSAGGRLLDILLERRFWLSTHAEVHETSRVRAVRRWLAELVRAAQPRLAPFASAAPK